MWKIPLEIWQAAPKDAWWWMDAMPYVERPDDDYDPLDHIDTSED